MRIKVERLITDLNGLGLILLRAICQPLIVILTALVLIILSKVICKNDLIVYKVVIKLYQKAILIHASLNLSGDISMREDWYNCVQQGSIIH